jgi:hypothetical protein
VTPLHGSTLHYALKSKSGVNPELMVADVAMCSSCVVEIDHKLRGRIDPCPGSFVVDFMTLDLSNV